MSRCVICDEPLGAPRVIALDAMQLMSMIAAPVFMHAACARQTVEPGLLFIWPVRMNTRLDAGKPFDLRPVLKIGRLEALDNGEPAAESVWSEALDEALAGGLEFIHRLPEGERRDKLERMLHERRQAFGAVLRGEGVSCF